MSAVPHAPSAQPDRWWAWHSTDDSRYAEKISLLACLETLLAVVSYWFVAVQFGTHIHLLTSALVAPFLLLRSPESTKDAINWWLHESEPWREIGMTPWPKQKGLWIVLVTVVLSFVSSFAFRAWLPREMATESPAKYVAVLSASSITSTTTILGCLLLPRIPIPRFGTVLRSAILGGLAANALSAFGYTGVTVQLFVVMVGLSLPAPFAGFGLGLAVRSVTLRISATALYLPRGIAHVAKNWRDATFIIDSTLLPEFLPDGRKYDPQMSLDGYLKRFRREVLMVRIGGVFIGAVFLFLPSCLYRLNLKATAWFWWPLAYLLRPVYRRTTEASRSQWLCWPWTNPIERLLIGFSIILALASVFAFFINYSLFFAASKFPALPTVLRVLFAFKWKEIAPWHVAQWTIAACGAGMLYLAAEALSHKHAGNLEEHIAERPWLLGAMTYLYRVRRLATIALLFMGLGALLLLEPSFTERLPESWQHALGVFYRVE